MTDGGVVAEALRRAREADDLIWSHRRSGIRHLQDRDRAVAQALAAGASVEQVADELGVLTADVERMREAARRRATIR